MCNHKAIGICQPSSKFIKLFYDKQFLLDVGVELSLAINISTSSSRSSNTKHQATTIKKNRCKVCSKPISYEKMRGHIACHIIKLEIESSACGFCGLPSCTNKLVQSSKTNKNKFFKNECNCDYFFSYGRKPVYSKREKCSNHLARCEVTKCSNHLARCEVTKCSNHLARCEVTKCSNHLARCEVTKCSNHLARCEVTKCSNHLARGNKM